MGSEDVNFLKLRKKLQKTCRKIIGIFSKKALPALASALVIGIFLKTLSPSLIDLNPAIPLSSPAIFGAIAIILLIIIPVGLTALETEFKKASLHNNKTYLDFAVCIFAWLSLFFIMDSLVDKIFSKFPLVNSSYIFAAIFGIISVDGFFLKYQTRKKPLNVETLKRRFAPEASNDDDLNFSESARKAATAIKNEKKYVSVVALNGGYGEGKSSYARMIIESIGIKKSLYSYISLTETNATNDFSKLFAKRWFEALNERYPTINIAPHVASLEAILRESTNHSALVSAISQILVKLNFGLNKTVAKFWDLNALKKEEGERIFVPNSTAAMFNYIPEIKEDVWIINIDEIERAQLDEIYRVIEVIERFKHEGRFGLPVKLVFLLCVSGSDLQKRLENLKGFGNEKAQLIEDFFFNNPKSRDQNLFLPFVSSKLKEKFVVESLEKVLGKEELGLIKNPNSTNSNPFEKFFEKLGLGNKIESKNPEGHFLDETSALNWLIKHFLCQESPRMIAKICQELEFFYRGYRDLEGKFAANKLAICDAIGIAIIKMKYPLLIEVFKHFVSTEYYFFGKTHLDQASPKIRLENVISCTFSDEKDAKILIDKIDSFLGLVGIICHGICRKTPDGTPDGIEEFLRTSRIKKMIDVLGIHEDESYTHREIYYGTLSLDQASNEELLKYSYRLEDTAQAPWNKHFDLAQELFERLEIGTTKDRKFIITRADNNGDKTYKDGVGEFVIAISCAIGKAGNKEGGEKYKKIWQLIQNFLSSDKILIEAKYILLNQFINENRVAPSSTELDPNFLDPNFLFEKIVASFDLEKSGQLKELIKKVFLDAKNRYFLGNKSIYENEENFSYVLYQSWNGKKDSPKNLSAIIKAAERDLEKYPQAIEYYWKKYDQKDGKEFEIISLQNLYKITEKAIELTTSQDLKNNLLGRLESVKKITNQNPEQMRSETYIEDCSENELKPLMMAMIEQGYIDESVSFFAD